jgi:nicotinate-nucleotide--dimethylbenzimidazole phosphoribosyltransferase
LSLIRSTMQHIAPLDAAAMQAARERQDTLTKPLGSLGRLEALSVQLAGIQRRARPDVSSKAIFVIAGDHGCVAEGVSAYPQEVTPQMVLNFARGGAAINVLARHVGARVIVVDIGVAGDCAAENVITRKVARGTRNMAVGPAMSADEARRCVEIGIEILESELARGLDLAGTGDMGIGNTTPSAAIIAAFTGSSPADVTGRGTGLDDVRLHHKISVIQRALDVNRPDPTDPWDVLAKVGGFEIGGLVGVMLAAAAHRIPAVVDGVISGAAAMLATHLCPQVRDYLIAGHLSVEPGHRAALEHMKLEPVLDLGMRLGEGTGGALAMSIVDAAAKTLNEMATFASAGVSEALEEECERS